MMSYEEMANRLNLAWRVLRYVAPSSLPAEDHAGPLRELYDGRLGDDCLQIAGRLRTLHRGEEHPVWTGSMADSHRADYATLDEHRKLLEAIRVWTATAAGDDDANLRAQADALAQALKDGTDRIVRRWD